MGEKEKGSEMSIFEVEKKNPVDLGMWASVYIKWEDDRGRAFDGVISFIEEEEWIEIRYRHAEAGNVLIRISKEGIRWIEFFKTKPEFSD